MWQIIWLYIYICVKGEVCIWHKQKIKGTHDFDNTVVYVDHANVLLVVSSVCTTFVRGTVGYLIPDFLFRCYYIGNVEQMTVRETMITITKTYIYN